MEIKIILIGAVVIGLIVILVLPSNVLGGEPKTIDCGSNATCLEERALSCSPATASLSTESISWKTEITGREADSCKIKFTITSVNKSSNYLSAFPSDLRGMAGGWSGKSMDCLVPLSEENYNPLNMSEYCEGELKQALETTGNKFNEFLLKLQMTSRACIPQTVWDFNQSSYKVLGLEVYNGFDVCHVSYSVESPERTGKISIDHYFNNREEELKVSYSNAPIPPTDFSAWCLAAPVWSHRGEAGTAELVSAAPISLNGTMVCKMDILIEPSHPELPGARITAYVAPDATTLLSIRTSGGNTIQKAYAPSGRYGEK